MNRRRNTIAPLMIKEIDDRPKAAKPVVTLPMFETEQNKMNRRRNTIAPLMIKEIDDRPKAAKPVVRLPMFETEPIGDKPVSALPGVGAVTNKRFTAKGYYHASQVLGYFLILKMDKVLFRQGMMDDFGITRDVADRIWEALYNWCSEFL